MDPEVGLSVVDLGLVYRATRGDDGIEVALTLTTRACPLGEMILEDARERLARRFQDAPRIAVGLVWSPPWSPELITDRGCELLGRPPRNVA
jgi:metal-sulfur cluster biosynthetic enzyme